jgi:homoserine O-acetyltransferase
MTRELRRAITLAALPIVAAVSVRAQTPPPTVASLGTCRLESGVAIPDCRVAYRTFGRLDASRSNAVLRPTWLLGRSEDWTSLLGPQGLVDTTRYHAIVVDAFANGHSSSPSNAAPAGHAAFRDLTIGDMVESQHRLLTERLQIPRLHAVVGISMGGMQALEWAVRYPTFAQVVIPIVGSPRVPAFDRVLWTMILSEIENGRSARVPDDSIWTQLTRMMTLLAETPVGLNRSSAGDVETRIVEYSRGLRTSWALDDYAAQLRAIRRHDVSARFGGDLSAAAKSVRARVLAIYSWDDHLVTAGPMAAFATWVRADTLSIPSACGHAMVFCEQARIAATVRAFLAK